MTTSSNALPWTEQQELLKSAAGAKFRMAGGGWREARMVPLNAVDADEEETPHPRISAPDTDVADSSYSGARAAVLSSWPPRRSGFQRTADTFARWAHEMADHAARCALLVYVVEGSQGEHLGALLARKRAALGYPTGRKRCAKARCWRALTMMRAGRLLTILYPSLARSIGGGPLAFRPWHRRA